MADDASMAVGDAPEIGSGADEPFARVAEDGRGEGNARGDGGVGHPGLLLLVSATIGGTTDIRF
jgi:hypothetical protein